MVSNWKRLQDDTADAFRYINKKFGKYPYTKYSVIQGGDGGMEYPMATLITGERSYPSLLSVTIHEVLHSWYQMLLGTNESYLAWMDEGFTSFAQNITFNNEFNDIYKLDSKNPLEVSYNRYYNFIKTGLEEPLSTHSSFENNGYTLEEMKMVWETHKIFEDKSIEVNPTAVRVPVRYGHSESIGIITESYLSIGEVRELLSGSLGIQLMEDDESYPMPLKE